MSAAATAYEVKVVRHGGVLEVAARRLPLGVVCATQAAAHLDEGQDPVRRYVLGSRLPQDCTGRFEHSEGATIRACAPGCQSAAAAGVEKCHGESYPSGDDLLAIANR